MTQWCAEFVDELREACRRCASEIVWWMMILGVALAFASELCAGPR